MDTALPSQPARPDRRCTVDVYTLGDDGYELTVEDGDFQGFLEEDMGFTLLPASDADQLRYAINFLCVGDRDLLAGQSGDTMTHPDHRGRGLGWFAKTHSHASVRAQWPLAGRLITGNASENDYMLAINRRLGYRPIAASGWFEHRMRG